MEIIANLIQIVHQNLTMSVKMVYVVVLQQLIINRQVQDVVGFSFILY